MATDKEIMRRLREQYGGSSDASPPIDEEITIENSGEQPLSWYERLTKTFSLNGFNWSETPPVQGQEAAGHHPNDAADHAEQIGKRVPGGITRLANAIGAVFICEVMTGM